MEIYIQGTGNISPQQTFGDIPFLAETVEHAGNRLRCIEPIYKELIDAKVIRRMSRIIRMGVAAALQCLKEADNVKPDAIVTGTAYGCLEDTGVFLKKLIETGEEVFTPTAFIQSTHNTIGAQIALMLQCTGYNNAFANGGGSFESALLDAMMLLEEGEAENVLVGGIDEITDVSHAVLTRFGLYKAAPISNLNLFATSSKGTIAGEGAAFFLLSNQQTAESYAQVAAFDTFHKPVGLTETAEHIIAFLDEQNISPTDLDLIILGENGDAGNDSVYQHVKKAVFRSNVCINYKHLCGEYPTAAAFALWLGAKIIKTKSVPAIFKTSDKPLPVRNLLIYNHYQNLNHTLILLSAC